MFDKLQSIERRYDEILELLGKPEVQGDQSEYRKHAKTLSEIEPVVERFREYKTLTRDITQTEELAAAGDADMRELAQQELKSLTARTAALLTEVTALLVPKDPNDERKVIPEIRAGAVGDEATLF